MRRLVVVVVTCAIAFLGLGFQASGALAQTPANGANAANDLAQRSGKPRPSLSAGCGTYHPLGVFDGFYWDVSLNPSPYYEGASAYIVVQTSLQCTGIADPNRNFVAAWTMIASGDPNEFAYAQVGFQKTISGPNNPHNATYWFSQYIRPGTSPVIKWSTTAQSRGGWEQARVPDALLSRLQLHQHDN